jgi:PGF-CTERM protein
VDAPSALARLGTYDLPPDGRLRYDGDYRLDTGGSATPDSLVVDAANVTLDGDGGAFAADDGGAVLTTTANATSLTVRDLTVRGRPVGVEATDLTTLELANVSAETTTALRASNVSNVTLTNVSPDDAPSFDLRGENLGVALDSANAPPNRSRLSAAPNLTFAHATNVDGTNGTNTTNATVTLRYDESHANESTVAVWTNADGDWTETNASVDADANAVTFEASENGTYGVYAVGDPAANRTNLSLSAEVDATATGDAAVSNVGRANLTVLDADVVGPDADLFGLADPPKNVTVTPGTTLDVTVSYAPNASGTHAATLSVTTAELGVLDVALDGTATVPTTPTPTPSPTPTPTATSTPADDDSSGSGSSGAPPPPPAPSTPEPTTTAAQTVTQTATPTVTPTTTPTVTATQTVTNTPTSTPTPRSERAAAERKSETATGVERTATDVERTTASAERTAAAQSNESDDGRATPAVTGTGVPGFSPVTAVVAVAAAALLLLRRD